MLAVSYSLVTTVSCSDTRALSSLGDGGGGEGRGRGGGSVGGGRAASAESLTATAKATSKAKANALPRSSTHPQPTPVSSPGKTVASAASAASALRLRHCLVCSAMSSGSLDALNCAHCREPLLAPGGPGPGSGTAAGAFNHRGRVWHRRCFVCAQCFQPFPDGKFYEFDGRKFCEYDFSVLFKPCCAKCGDFIVGRVVRALQASWHPVCFACHACGCALTDAYVKGLGGRALCRQCGTDERLRGSAARHLCSRCRDAIEAGQLLRHGGEVYHAYHFSCADCRAELTSEAREKDGQLYCARCFDRLGVPVCARCRRPIDQERVVHAAGKTWHVAHFVCAACEKPFNGTRHFERRGQAYCAVHFQRLFGHLCFLCGDTISDRCVQACGKSWCSAHFQCSVCDRLMNQKSKFYEYDLKPVCKHCYQRFPTELRKRLAKIHKQSR